MIIFEKNFSGQAANIYEYHGKDISTLYHRIFKRNVVDFKTFQYEKFNTDNPIGYVIDGDYGNTLWSLVCLLY